MGAADVVADAGWDALERGDWPGAVECFEKALLEPDPARPRTIEGRAWAAWWTADADTLFTMREAAFHAYRHQGDNLGAARQAIWLGSDHHDFLGEHAVANGWFQRARRLLAGMPTTEEHGWLAFHEGAYAIELEEDAATAAERGREVVAVGEALGDSDLVFIGLALLGLALVTSGELEEGMRCIDEAGAAAASGELRNRIGRTWTLCYTIYACERARDFDRSAQWCQKMEEVASAFGAGLAVGVCRAHFGGVLMLRGDWERAESELHAAGQVLARARPPVVIEATSRLGELRRRQGRLDDAELLFEESMPHPTAVLGLAAVQLDRGRVDDAVATLTSLLEELPAEARAPRADVHLALVQVHAAAGDAESARHHAALAARIAELIRSRTLDALVLRAEGLCLLVEADAASARHTLERAAAQLERVGLPFEAAVSRRELAGALRGMGREVEAEEQERRASDRFAGLGVRAGRDLRSPSGGASGDRPLTSREMQVLAALADGLTDRQIAMRLVVSPHTVHRHVSNILTKLGVASRAAAVAVAARNGYLG